MAGALTLREGPRIPTRVAAAACRDDPELENRRRLVFKIVFGVADAGAGAHDLDVAGFCAAFIAEAVLVRDRALPYIGDDLHIGVRVRRKAGLRRDLVVVPDAQRAPIHALGIAVIGKGEMMAGVEPAVVAAAQAVESSAFDH